MYVIAENPYIQFHSQIGEVGSLLDSSMTQQINDKLMLWVDGVVCQTHGLVIKLMQWVDGVFL
jgi:hypothetical protein